MSTTATFLNRIRIALLLAALAGPVWTSPPALADGPEIAGTAEVIRYRWRLKGIGGLLARLLPGIPASGEGELRTDSAGQDRAVCSFRATSPKAADGEHWTYTVEIDLAESRTLRVVDALSFRGKQKKKVYELAEQEVVDVLSGLHLISRSVPETEERAVIWSNRKTYPVVITPHGLDRRRIQGRQIELRHVTIRGVKEKGEKRWSSQADIWFSREDPAKPVEILYRQSLGELHMVEIDDPPMSAVSGPGRTDDPSR